MFDVYWTDHNRELVGERAVRKEREERESKEKAESDDGKKPHDKVRYSIAGSTSSSISGSSSPSQRAFGFFNSKSRRRVTTPSRLEGAAQDPVLDGIKSKRLSEYDVRNVLSNGDYAAHEAACSPSPSSRGMSQP
jgi:hypothetical protein